MINITMNVGKDDSKKDAIIMFEGQLSVSNEEAQQFDVDVGQSFIFNQIDGKNLFQSRIFGGNPFGVQGITGGRNLFTSTGVNATIEESHSIHVWNLEFNRTNRSISSGLITVVSPEAINSSELTKESGIMIKMALAFDADDNITGAQEFDYRGIITSVELGRWNSSEENKRELDASSQYVYTIHFTSELEFILEHRKMYANMARMAHPEGYYDSILIEAGKIDKKLPARKRILSDKDKPEECFNIANTFNRFFHFVSGLNSNQVYVKTQMSSAYFTRNDHFDEPRGLVGRNVNYVLNGTTFIDFLRSPFTGDSDFLFSYSRLDGKKTCVGPTYLNPSDATSLTKVIDDMNNPKETSWTLGVSKFASEYSQNRAFTASDSTITASLFVPLIEKFDDTDDSEYGWYYAHKVSNPGSSNANTKISLEKVFRNAHKIFYYFFELDRLFSKGGLDGEFDAVFMISNNPHRISGYKFSLSKISGLRLELYSPRFHETNRLLNCFMLQRFERQRERNDKNDKNNVYV